MHCDKNGRGLKSGLSTQFYLVSRGWVFPPGGPAHLVADREHSPPQSRSRPAANFFKRRQTPMTILVPAGLARSMTVAMLVLFAGAGAASALECPKPNPEFALTSSQVSPEQIKTFQNALRGPDPANAIGFYVHALKSSHPNMTDADIVNSLATMYCQVLVETKCADAIASQKLVEFNKLVAAQVFGGKN